MRETASPPVRAPKQQRYQSRQEDSRASLRRKRLESRVVDAESDRQRMSSQLAEQLGPEYWLG
jgi:hypothetical protein